MIAITGVTGTVGSLTARRLMSSQPLRLLSRRPGRVREMGLTGECVAVDLADRAGLTRSLAGVRAVLAVTANPLAPGHDVNLVEAAKAAGVAHIVKLSALAVTDPMADDLITRWQRDNEDRIRAAGIEWTFLRPRAFMSNTLGWAESIRRTDTVAALHGGAANACVDPREIAEVAARALTEPGHAGRAYSLTGPEPLSPAEQTAQLGRVLGRPLRFRELTVDQARAAWRRRYPAPVAQALLESAARRAAGAKCQVASVSDAVLGRPAGTFRAWAADHHRRFR